MPWRSQSEPTVAERACAGFSYFTFGVIGLIYILFFNKSGEQSELFRFHFLQAILLSIFAMLLSYAAGPMGDLLGQFIRFAPESIATGLQSGLAWTGLILVNAFRLLLVYGAIFCFLGKFAEVPVISNVVRQNMR
jgi:hypothetical protein